MHHRHSVGHTHGLEAGLVLELAPGRQNRAWSTLRAPHTSGMESRLSSVAPLERRELPQAKSSLRRSRKGRVQGSPRSAAPPREHQEHSLHAFARTILLRVDTLGAAGRAPVLERHGMDADGGGGGDVDRHDRRVLLAVGVDLATVRRPLDLTEHAQRARDQPTCRGGVS